MTAGFFKKIQIFRVISRQISCSTSVKTQIRPGQKQERNWKINTMNKQERKKRRANFPKVQVRPRLAAEGELRWMGGSNVYPGRQTDR
jgi:hypothetical protein